MHAIAMESFIQISKHQGRCTLDQRFIKLFACRSLLISKISAGERAIGVSNSRAATGALKGGYPKPTPCGVKVDGKRSNCSAESQAPVKSGYRNVRLHAIRQPGALHFDGCRRLAEVPAPATRGAGSAVPARYQVELQFQAICGGPASFPPKPAPDCVHQFFLLSDPVVPIMFLPSGDVLSIQGDAPHSRLPVQVGGRYPWLRTTTDPSLRNHASPERVHEPQGFLAGQTIAMNAA